MPPASYSSVGSNISDASGTFSGSGVFSDWGCSPGSGVLTAAPMRLSPGFSVGRAAPDMAFPPFEPGINMNSAATAATASAAAVSAMAFPLPFPGFVPSVLGRASPLRALRKSLIFANLSSACTESAFITAASAAGLSFAPRAEGGTRLSTPVLSMASGGTLPVTV